MARGSRGAARDGEAPPAPEALPVAVADAHCHLDLMGLPLTEAVLAAQAVGVERIVTIGIDLETSRWAAEATGHAQDLKTKLPENAAKVSADELYARFERGGNHYGPLFRNIRSIAQANGEQREVVANLADTARELDRLAAQLRQEVERFR